MKITPKNPKNESGLIQLIMMGKSIRQILVKLDVWEHLRVPLNGRKDLQGVMRAQNAFAFLISSVV